MQRKIRKKMQEGRERKEKNNEGAVHAAATQVKPAPNGHAGEKPKRLPAHHSSQPNTGKGFASTPGSQGLGNVRMTPHHKARGFELIAALRT